MSDFGNASGLKMNFDKTILFPLGPFTHSKPYFVNDFPITWSKGPVTMLGITFTCNREDLFQLNFPPKLSRLKRSLNLWTQRDITPIGRNILFKTFAISKLVYLFQTLPNPPSSFILELNSILYNFIWNDKPDKVKRQTIINPIHLGGLKVIHLESFIHSLKITWIKRYLSESNGVWKIFLDYYLSDFGKEFFFKCNFSKDDIPKINNLFVYDICKAWSLFNFKEPISKFENEIIWNNSHIKVDNKIVFYQFLYSKGIDHVYNFFNNDKKLMQFNEFVAVYNLDNFPFTRYNGLISAIPTFWKQNLQNTDYSYNHNEDLLNRLLAHKSVSQWAYGNIANEIFTPPTALQKWNYHFENDKWSNIFSSAWFSVRDVKLHYFQFRFLHRILGTNRRLHLMKFVESPLCSFCKIHEETIEHLFWNCHIVSSFLLDVETMFIGRCFVFSKEDFFFGFKQLLKHPYNFLIYHSKFYIFQCKQVNKLPNIFEFEYKFKFALEVEKQISMRKASKRYFTYNELHDTFRNIYL